ncbi:MAG TPA: hypothetical protein VG842_10960, partial [Sediminibacterium sp.]|nr:hypothetical protein [Sediminibacterium sp.]
DGAEQYFSRAYEFGFSKNATEALRIWDREKVLSDVVWMIRKFQPDIIITRFPGDARAGHGHHAASSILAQEAFTAAADPKKFPEQFQYGVKPWQAKRILWNTFNFGGNNTTAPDQLKIAAGIFNPLLGESYGEIGGEARTMHKSQGEGRPHTKGNFYEFFQTLGGEAPQKDLMDGVNTTWSRIPGTEDIAKEAAAILASYNFVHPETSVPALVRLYKAIAALPASNWRDQKLKETQQLVEACAGLYTEATTRQDYVVQGGQLQVSCFVNQRNAAGAVWQQVQLAGFDSSLQLTLPPNQNMTVNAQIPVPEDQPVSQPYWLQEPKQEGIFTVRDQTQIGKAWNDPPFSARFRVKISDVVFTIERPVMYKYVDPARGELYEPVPVLPRAEINFTQDNYISLNGQPVDVTVHLKENGDGQQAYPVSISPDPDLRIQPATLRPAIGKDAVFQVTPARTSESKRTVMHLEVPAADHAYSGSQRTIAYNHIPVITYFTQATANLVNLQIKTVGHQIGYIAGAGDKLPQALEAMGYAVTALEEKDITAENLQRFDAVILGIRAANLFEYITDKQAILNEYVRNGGNLIAQYIKSNNVGQRRIQLGPYPFSISTGLRVTEEDAKVDFVRPDHPVLNYPNKITEKDFEGWVQERSTYQVEQADSHYEMPLGMHDTGEHESRGSLAIAPFGKGNFAYVSLVLFRQLPAGIPGAYRILANLIALPKH